MAVMMWADVPLDQRGLDIRIKRDGSCAAAWYLTDKKKWMPCYARPWFENDLCVDHLRRRYRIFRGALSDPVFLRFPTRIQNALARAGLVTAAAVARVPDRWLLELRSLGTGSLAEIRAAIPYQPDCPTPRATVPCPMCNGVGTVAAVV